MRVSVARISLSLAVLLLLSVDRPTASAQTTGKGIAGLAEQPQSSNAGSCETPAFGNILCPSDACNCPYWSFTAEAVALQRTATRDQPLFRSTQQTDLLNANDLEFPLAFGYQLSAIRHDVGGCGWDLEIAYLQVDGFDAQADVAGRSQMILDVNGINWTVRNANAHYTSALYSGEINARCAYDDWLTLLVGFRMGQLNEHYLGRGVDYDAPLVDYSVGTGAFNHLYGIQIGADAEVYNMGGPLAVRTFCKAGVFDNVAEQHYLRTSGGAADEPLMAHRDQAAFLGEAGVVATYSLTRRLAFRASAQAMWLTGVALAPEQIQEVDLRTGQATINTSGTVFYYGGGLGLEYRF